MPRVTLYPKPSGMSENVNTHSYTLSPAVVTAHLWETAFSATTEGFVEAQGLIGQSTYMPSVVSFLAATATTSFVLPTAEPAADTAKMIVFVNGISSTSWTQATTQVVTSTAPGNNKRVVVFYEHS
jgi:hypothetical protein